MAHHLIGKYMIVSPAGFVIHYSARTLKQDSIDSVVAILGRSWETLEKEGYHCMKVGKPQKVEK